MNLPLVVLLRDPSSDQGTLGNVFVDGRLFCHAVELPDRDNQQRISFIPKGKYLCKWHKSPKYGWVYLVTGVPGRSFILIHPGNWAGDVRKGFKSNSMGCLLFGRRRGLLSGQKAVMVSRPAVRDFNRKMAKQDFYLLVA